MAESQSVMFHRDDKNWWQFEWNQDQDIRTGDTEWVIRILQREEDVTNYDQNEVNDRKHSSLDSPSKIKYSWGQ